MPETKKIPGGKLTFYAKEVLQNADNKIQRAMLETVQLVENHVRKLQTGPRTGRIYRIGKTPTKADKLAGRKFRSHQASAPGEPPAVWSGRLFNAIVSKVEPILGKTGMGWRGEVGTNVKYARWLEFGTTRMKPRPLWRRAVIELRAKILDIWKRAAQGGP